MNKIRTFYWEDRIYGPLRYYFKTYLRGQTHLFRNGNAGDIYCRDLIKHIYKISSKNLKNEGRRLLLIGSVSHNIMPEDVICGIGSLSSSEISKEISRDVQIYGLRGPLTYDLMKREGFDVSSVKFLLDPGLLIKHTIPEEFRGIVGENISFIPHYREKFSVMKDLPKEIHLIDIDNHPHNVAKEILKSKVVYSSSLHGIIFAHSLGRPCVFVKPQTGIGISKFEDYFLSVDLKFPKPLDSILDYVGSRNFETMLKNEIKMKDFFFPDTQELRSRGILS